MKEDCHQIRFMIYLSLFTFCMIIFITAENLVQAFLGWECVGIMSFLLINFWNTRIQANKAGIQALIINRIGDTGFLIGICMICKFLSTTGFSEIFNLILLENIFS